jgi:protein-tyrosine-phosphatase
MAAGWAHRLGGGAVRVFSGGSAPAEEVNPVAVEAMTEVGIDLSTAVPRTWTEEIIRDADVVITMGCGDSCPIVPGVRYEDWELEDPAGLPLERVRPIRDEIRTRVESLLKGLGIQTGR